MNQPIEVEKIKTFLKIRKILIERACDEYKSEKNKILLLSGQLAELNEILKWIELNIEKTYH